ncbi:hypothetical protein T458_20040 [Brevibacillus panacihumi W25]|uniref:Uncharacterized protein n=1 Tax=Brevibacillus panacihumi W25 TaxID=1408254 RepID=V6MES0_9BACL|nr:hypothetical protein [Brevibacillus panacihumi]EST53883.1 hypothetical protein T458_20040 [Brevibacillus panacihumi W25]
MACTSCGYEFDPNQVNWRYHTENLYIILAPVHHESIFKQIVDHYVREIANGQDDEDDIWIIIDEYEPEYTPCNECWLQNRRTKHRMEKLYGEQNITFGFTF